MIVKLLGHNWRNLTNEHKSIIQRANNSSTKKTQTVISCLLKCCLHHWAPFHKNIIFNTYYWKIKIVVVIWTRISYRRFCNSLKKVRSNQGMHLWIMTETERVLQSFWDWPLVFHATFWLLYLWIFFKNCRVVITLGCNSTFLL